MGPHVVVGDLVALSKEALDNSVDTLDADYETSSAEPEMIEESRTSKSDPTSGIHVVTEEDIAFGRYSMRDVVLPLIGRDTLYPFHPTGEYMRSLLQERNLLNHFESSHQNDLIQRGAYRRVIEYPDDFTYRLVNYSHADDILQSSERNTLFPSETSPETLQSEQTHLGLVIEFNLPPGSYATMLLRELTKTHTDSSYHAQLSAASGSHAGKRNERDQEKNSEINESSSIENDQKKMRTE
jgi:tRNA(Glu) U13 pseudouridine synthase TruD